MQTCAHLKGFHSMFGNWQKKKNPQNSPCTALPKEKLGNCNHGQPQKLGMFKFCCELMRSSN